MDVGTTHKDYQLSIKLETLITDFMDEDKVKKKAIDKHSDIGDYLMIPRTYIDKDKKEDALKFKWLVYHSYMPEFILKDARIKALGVCFKQSMQISLPDQLQELVTNADRLGNSLESIAKDALDSLLISGRHGYYSDITEDGKPYISSYKSKTIPQFKETSQGYYYLELRESDVVDGKEIPVIKRLQIVDGVVEATTWKQSEKQGAWTQEGDATYPTLHKGQKLDYIPASIINEKPALEAMAKSVKTGFQKSAIYGSMVDTLGSGKVFIFSDGAVTLSAGHEQGVKLSKGDDAKILQLRADGAKVVEGAMSKPFEAAIQQGLDIISQGANAASYENLYLQNSSKQLKIEDPARKVSDALTSALRDCAKLVGANEEEVSVKIMVELMPRPVDHKLMKELRDGVKDNLIKSEEYLKAVDDHVMLDIDKNADGVKDYAKYADDVREETKKRQAEEDARTSNIIDAQH